MRTIFRSVFFILLSLQSFSQKNVSDSLRKILDNNPARDTSRVLTLVQYSYSLLFTRPDSMMQYADEALQLSTKLDWQRGIAKSFIGKGLASSYGLNNQTAALDFYLKALGTDKNGYDYKNIAFNATNLIGIILYNQKQYNKALEYFTKAYTLMRAAGNTKNEEGLLLNIGNVYYDKNQKDSAKLYFTQCLAMAELKNNIQVQSVVLSSLSTFYLRDSNYLAANQYVLRSKLLSGLTGNHLVQAVSLVNLSLVKLGLHQADSAIIYGKEALTIAELAGSMQYRREAWQALSSAYEYKNMFKEALAATKNFSILNDSLLSDESKQEVTRNEMKFEQAKKEAIQEAEINRQKTIKNSIITGVIILLVASFISFIFYKNRRDARQKQQEAEFKSEVADTEMKALRAQMNPHFIFNSLNSISDYIAKNDTQSADRYLSKFAKLMRVILENSEQKEVTLADDLKALELYIQLEALRMNNKFSYEILVDNGVDKEATMVPPLILQPFVENSIWHGIAKKEGLGKILIHIKKEGEDMINCIVEDDGIGRQQAMLVKTSLHQQEQPSLGMKITQARIDILNKIKNTKAVVELSDLAQGLRVEVKLPLATNF